MENLTQLEGQKCTFKVPSGFEYTIREQNGNDDDIISNQAEAQTLTNLSRFIAAIVVDTNYTDNRKLTLEQAHNLPSLDRYAILINSRIFSLGKELEFTWDWKDKGGQIDYSVDLEEFIFDYGTVPTEEEINNKPNAIPYYPLCSKYTNIELELTSGKKVKFDLLTAKGESFVINLPIESRTKNKELEARNLCLEVNGKWEKVTSFHVFSVKDMAEIRKQVNTYDPLFDGITTVTNPYHPELSQSVSIMGLRGFFYPEEI